MQEAVKSWLSIVQSAVTTLGILAAGAWFITQGQTHPKLNIEYKISHRRLQSLRNQVLVAIEVVPTNVGNVALDLNCGTLRVYNLDPGDEDGNVYQLWPDESSEKAPCNLPSVYMEPAESEHIPEYIRVKDSTRVLRVVASFPNITPRQNWLGWIANVLTRTNTRSLQWQRDVLYDLR
jgi:hypothetical protein